MTSIAIFGLATISFGQTLPSYVPSDGLVGWWPFNGNANDESGNGNDGAVNGDVALTTDRFGIDGKAYSFPGNSNSFIDVNNSASLQIQNNLSISVWFVMQGGDQNPRILSIGDGSGYGIYVNGISDDSRVLDAIFANSGGDFTGFCCENGISVTAQIWQNIVFTVDSTGNSKLYLNGILNSTSNGIPINNALYTTNLNFGRLTIPSFDAWGGKLDDIGIWNRALTEQEITSLHFGSSLGINELSLNNSFSVFPNPAQSVINVNIEANLVGSVFTIYDNTGKAVKTGKLNSSNTTIEVNDLSGGVYSFSVGGNRKQTFKVIKE